MEVVRKENLDHKFLIYNCDLVHLCRVSVSTAMTKIAETIDTHIITLYLAVDHATESGLSTTVDRFHVGSKSSKLSQLAGHCRWL